MIVTSHRVRMHDFREPWFIIRANELHEQLNIHRKLWEFCLVSQVYCERITKNGNLLGFGVGREPLSAWFAKQGACVTATDHVIEDPAWAKTGQHACRCDDLSKPDICDDRQFKQLVEFRPVDMNDIPDDLRQGGFDLTWSCGSFEHLGSIEAGLTFFCKQMACLKPGGFAVHTTEFNPREGRPTLEDQNLVLFRRVELENLAARLVAQGDTLFPLDFRAGSEPEDLHIDREPWGLPHLSITIGGFVTTSILLVAQRGGL